MQPSTMPAVQDTPQDADRAALPPPILVAKAAERGPWGSTMWREWLAEYGVDAAVTNLVTIHQLADERLVVVVDRFRTDEYGRKFLDPDTGDAAREPITQIDLKDLPPLDCRDVAIRVHSKIVGADENGWIVRSPTGEIEFRCSCGIVGHGPRPEMLPQVNLHWERTIANRGVVNGACPSPR